MEGHYFDYKVCALFIGRLLCAGLGTWRGAERRRGRSRPTKPRLEQGTESSGERIDKAQGLDSPLTWLRAVLAG